MVAIELESLVVRLAALEGMGVVHESLIVAIYLSGMVKTLNIGECLAPILGLARLWVLGLCIRDAELVTKDYKSVLRLTWLGCISMRA